MAASRSNPRASAVPSRAPAKHRPPSRPVLNLHARLFVVTVGKHFPRSVRESLARLLVQAGMASDENLVLGLLWLDMLLAGLVALLAVARIVPDTFWPTLAFILAVCLVPLGFYLFLVARAEQRAAEIERSLPDVLQLVSANMRAGMTVEDALSRAASADVGALGRELSRITVEMETGTSLAEALATLSDNVRSDSLRQAIRLVMEGQRLGGQMAQLLYDIANTLREIQQLRSQMRSALMAYAIFIFLGATLAAPALFATTVFYAGMTSAVSTPSTTSSSMTGTTGGRAGITTNLVRGASSGQLRFTQEELRNVAYASLFIISACSSLLLGIIYGRRATAGLKYMVFIIPAAFAVFFVMSTAMKLFVSTIG